MVSQTNSQFHCSKVCLKAKFVIPSTLTTSESKFDRSNRILCLEVSALVYEVSTLTKSKLFINFSFSGHMTSHFDAAKQTVQLFFALMQDVVRG